MKELIILLLCLLASCGLLGWLVRRALVAGSLPIPFAGQIYQVSREEMPLVFWFCIGLLCFVALLGFVGTLLAVLFGKA